MRFIKTVEDRKELVRKLEELTGLRAVYTRMPECAYVVGDYKVEMKGTLLVEDDADMGPIEAMLDEGMIRTYEEMEHQTDDEIGSENEVETESEEPEPDPQEVGEADTEEEPDSLEEEETDTEDEPDPQEEEEADAEDEPDPQEEEETESEGAEEAEPEEEAEIEEEEDPNTQEEEAGPQMEEASDEAEDVHDNRKEQMDETHPSESTEDHDRTVVSFPMGRHGIVSLRNLVNMVCARGGLISKATGGDFSCTLELAEALAPINDMKAFLAILHEHEDGLHGLEIREDGIRFNGFPYEPEKVEAFTRLASLMNKVAQESKRVLPRPVEEENEKYIFRIWLIRLGMAGKEYAQTRKSLLEPLAGNSTFKDKAMEERWKAKRKATEADDAKAEEASLAGDDAGTIMGGMGN